jgi:hypothetical protein
MEVAATSQVLLGNIIFEWFLAKKTSGSALDFRWLKMIILCDEVQAPPAFSYTTSCRYWYACASFWTNFGWLYRQGGCLNFNRMLCCCRQGEPTKFLVS